MKLVLSFVAACVVLSIAFAEEPQQLVGAKKCSWGPSYWCNGLAEAKECGAMKHCVGAVWKQNVPQYKDTEECTACKEAVTEVDQLLADKKTQDEVKAALDQLCNACPVKDVQAKCTALVDQYLPEIISLILAELQPEKTCELVGLCQAQTAAPTQPMMKISAPKLKQPIGKVTIKASPTCLICEFAMKQLDNLLVKNATEQQIIAGLEKVCSYLPGTVKPDCIAFISQYGPAILQLLSSELQPKTVCTALGVCAAARIEMPKLGGGNAVECDTCKTAMNYVDQLLAKPAIVQDVQMVLEKVCNYLPAADQKQCDQIVDTYAPMLLKLILSELNPEAICTEAGLCSAQPHDGLVKLMGVAKKRIPRPVKYIPYSARKNVL